MMPAIPTKAPRYTPLEWFVMRQIREAGATRIGVAEPAHGDSDADVSAVWRGRQLFIQGYPTQVKKVDHEVLEVRRVGERRILKVREFNRRKLVFRCNDYTYEVSKSLDDRWNHALMENFVAALMEAAGCTDQARSRAA
jgi:hypothetical protein